MASFEHILFPVDFTERSATVAGAVAGYARRFGASVTLLHAFETHAEMAGQSELEGALDVLRERVARRLDGYLADLFPAAAVRVLVTGKPAPAIVEYAHSHRCDLIMMPTHGQTRFRQLLLGSVTSAVLHDAECAVWTSTHVESAATPTECRSIVCAIDLSASSADLLSRARRIAEDWGAALHVLHAVPGIDPRFDSAVAARAHAFLVMRAREDYGAVARQAGVSAELEIVEELGLGASVASGCRKHGADLLVIGRGAAQGFLGRLRTNAHDLIRSAPCPVLSL